MTAAWLDRPDRPGMTAQVRVPHSDAPMVLPVPADRLDREAIEDRWMVLGATRAVGAGRRARPELPDRYRTCFERDRDRIMHSTAFRRLAGKTQVFVDPADHQRTRLTHALEVTQVAGSIARACRLNVALTEAIALGHDCGHGPGGHASETALGRYLPGGFDHAVWGADVALVDLNLCHETLDGIRNHSWSRPAPATVEAEVVALADRVAYCCHDWEDAVRAGIVNDDQLPPAVTAQLGTRRPVMLNTLIGDAVRMILEHGQVGLTAPVAEALSGLRAACYRLVYDRPDSRRQNERVIDVVTFLVDRLVESPNLIPADTLRAASDDRVRAAVTHVAGMTDRYAFATAVQLGYQGRLLPQAAA